MFRPILSLLTLTATVFAVSTVNAAVTLPSVLSDGVILQRDAPITIWGKADPSEKVTVRLGTNTSSSIADSTGQWTATLAAMPAGGPYTLQVNDITVNDVLLGDLYLCSGQSNMELPINRVMDRYAEEVNAYENTRIREFKTPKECAFHGPKDDVSPTPWKQIRPSERGNFGALVYFIGKHLYENNGHVPVGIINSSWGGSRIQAWLSEKALATYPALLNRMRIMNDDAYRDLLTETDRRATGLWFSTLNSTDPGYQDAAAWSSPDFDDSSWQPYDLLSTSWGSSDSLPVNGSHWLRKNIDIPAKMAGQAATLRLGCIVDADSVWVNGQCVGNISYQYPPRIYAIPAGLLHEGENNITVRVVSYSGTPHFVPEKPHKIIFPSGDEISLEGTWRHHTGAPMPPYPTTTDMFQTPSVLYNGLIAPMAHIPFRGAVWYQGESDVDNHTTYASMLKTLMADWRSTFGNPSLPFYIIELADYLHPSDTQGRHDWHQMREAQRQAAEQTSGAHWIKNRDTGEWNDIHPLDKKTPATRTAEAILRDAKK